MPADNPLFHPRYPRSNTYEVRWVIDNLMGPHPLWLMESLSEVLGLSEGMQVLDLGCGTALTSIFLAKEFGVHVTAADLWIDAAANEERVAAAGLEGHVAPVDAEAHALPFRVGQFDVIVSVDAYHYFGTDDLYIGSISEYLRPGGQIGIVVPSVREELDGIPEVLAPYWQWEFCSFHTASWWRRHWEKTGKVKVDVADTIEGGWGDWLRFDEISAASTDGWRKELAQQDAALLRADNGAHLCFTRMVASKA